MLLMVATSRHHGMLALSDNRDGLPPHLSRSAPAAVVAG